MHPFGTLLDDRGLCCLSFQVVLSAPRTAPAPAAACRVPLLMKEAWLRCTCRRVGFLFAAAAFASRLNFGQQPPLPSRPSLTEVEGTCGAGALGCSSSTLGRRISWSLRRFEAGSHRATRDHLDYRLEPLHLTFGHIFMVENIRRDFLLSEFKKKFAVIFNVTLLK